MGTLLYNKALINQLVRSIRKNIRTLVVRKDLTSFGPLIKTASEYFPVWTSQLVNIILDSEVWNSQFLECHCSSLFITIFTIVKFLVVHT